MADSGRSRQEVPELERRYCCAGAARDGVDDAGFLVAVIDQVQTEYRSDPASVFVVGVSNGGTMA